MKESNQVENVIIANFGNGSIALIQWAIEQGLQNVVVISVDTGWASTAWNDRYKASFRFMESKRIPFRHVESPKSFEESVIDRGGFPSPKFQWCAPFLKGLVLNETLDEIDPFCSAVIHLPKLRVSSRANIKLQSGQPSEYFQQRVLNYPLLDYSLEDRNKLITDAGFELLSHSSEECFPCIHSNQKDLLRMQMADKHRLENLEQTVGTKMQILKDHSSDLGERYDMGCGNIWSCGE